MTKLRLEEQLCFALYSASRAVTSAYRPLLDELGLTYPQYLVLLVLWEDDACSIGQLGDRLHLDSGTLSPLLKRLEAAGLVRRQRSDTDERRVEVTLTADGRALEDRAACVPERLLGSTDADPAQLAALRDALTLVTAEVYARNG
ncbi:MULTISPECIES: MarR family winged helix-turn-helix transcriptional regulator [Mycobacteriaceae]|uniref:MarR family transcriptional regulator n=1 Tax=Mycolicibacterium parafortuitum TaxID=39692 RepID=A0ACC6MBQ8_MYCPF|nr:MULTISPECIES: MarR family transcriptional regulator [Mycobacteriaceae]MDZ5084334.1 MarR family transcriptional regulator [Mycolicibacterium parafortuitum]GFM17782.1 MarR family transcriptional regulator [Mycobacterium sp. PO1]GFM24257.1 MarR family transcriptional regulator [Mycobacterium sp. PO2]